VSPLHRGAAPKTAGAIILMDSRVVESAS
jgi:hypothetical protein